MKEPFRITAVVTEVTSPRPPTSRNPLIYSLDITDKEDHDAILRQIADIRYDELGVEDIDGAQDSAVIDAIFDGLKLEFIFLGDLTPLTDFRD